MEQPAAPPGTNGNQQAIVQPSPVPVTVQVGQAIGPDAKPLVVIMFHSATGSSVHFLVGEDAEKVGNQLVSQGRITKAGLTIPGR